MRHLLSSDILHTLSFGNATAASVLSREGREEFKTLLKENYLQSPIGDLFDMATGSMLPHSTVVASHIFQRTWHFQLSRLTSLTNVVIDAPTNGLLLYKPVESAFDRARICIEVDGGDMTFRLLDHTLYNVRLVDEAIRLRGNRNQQLSQNEQNLQLTFGDLDGQPVRFPLNSTFRPSKRLLAFHAVAACHWQKTRDPLVLNPKYNVSDDDVARRCISMFIL